jgi:hypothetical protein
MKVRSLAQLLGGFFYFAVKRRVLEFNRHD